MKMKKCKCCNKPFIPSHKHPNQIYCFRIDCKKKRKAMYQRKKMKNDVDYRANQKNANKQWLKSNKNYYKDYRKKNPDKVKRNVILQAIRNYKNRSYKKIILPSSNSSNLIAKMELVNSSENNNNKYSGTYWLIPMIAKMELVNGCKSNNNTGSSGFIEAFY
jgi:hypothetical protein